MIRESYRIEKRYEVDDGDVVETFLVYKYTFIDQCGPEHLTLCRSFHSYKEAEDYIREQAGK